MRRSMVLGALTCVAGTATAIGWWLISDPGPARPPSATTSISNRGSVQSWKIDGQTVPDDLRLEIGKEFSMEAQVEMTSEPAIVKADLSKQPRPRKQPYVWNVWLRFAQDDPIADRDRQQNVCIFQTPRPVGKTIRATGKAKPPTRPGVYELQLVIGKQLAGDFWLDEAREGEVVAVRRVEVSEPL